MSYRPSFTVMKYYLFIHVLHRIQQRISRLFIIFLMIDMALLYMAQNMLKLNKEGSFRILRLGLLFLEKQIKKKTHKIHHNTAIISGHHTFGGLSIPANVFFQKR